jgi:hypothetical protein
MKWWALGIITTAGMAYLGYLSYKKQKAEEEAVMAAWANVGADLGDLFSDMDIDMEEFNKKFAEDLQNTIREAMAAKA